MASWMTIGVIAALAAMFIALAAWAAQDAASRETPTAHPVAPDRAAARIL